MADAPRCRKCIEKGITAQTYKIAGKQMYRCQLCKLVFPAYEFEPEEFLWKQEPEKYNTWKKNKLNAKGVGEP